MFRSLNIASTGMVAQETKLDTISNNLANSNTTGYKRQDAEFEDLLYQQVRAPGVNSRGTIAPMGVEIGAGSRVVATPRSFTQGTLQQTGNPLDIAIEGRGFLSVFRENGEIAYTRAGQLKLDQTGRLVSSEGLPLEPPITIPEGATDISIAADGTVSAKVGDQMSELGQLQITTFANPAGLNALGRNLYERSAASGEPSVGIPGRDARGTIMQGSVESSNVEVVNEMIALIRTQRAYEINSKVISAADEMLRNATQMR